MSFSGRQIGREFKRWRTGKLSVSPTSKTRSNLAKANEIASGGGSGTLDRDENLRYVWDGVWEGQEPGGKWERRVWDKHRGTGRVLLVTGEKVW